MQLFKRLSYKWLHRPRDEHEDSRERLLPASLFVLYYFLIPLLTTSFVLWAVLHTWHLQLSPSPYSPHPHHHSSLTHRWKTCGTTPTEALSRGCEFDILSFAWQTPECFDADLLDSFLHYSNWTFYTHPNRTDETVPLATALQGNRTLYVDWRYHVTHCVFMWRQMHRAWQVRGYVDSHLADYRHTMHCQGVLIEVEGVGMGEVRVVAEVKYPECREVSSLSGVGRRTVEEKGKEVGGDR